MREQLGISTTADESGSNVGSSNGEEDDEKSQKALQELRDEVNKLQQMKKLAQEENQRIRE